MWWYNHYNSCQLLNLLILSTFRNRILLWCVVKPCLVSSSIALSLHITYIALMPWVLICVWNAWVCFGLPPLLSTLSFTIAQLYKNHRNVRSVHSYSRNGFLCPQGGSCSSWWLVRKKNLDNYYTDNICRDVKSMIIAMVIPRANIMGRTRPNVPTASSVTTWLGTAHGLR